MRYTKMLCIVAMLGLTACSGGSDTSTNPENPSLPSQGPGDTGSGQGAHPVHGMLTDTQKALLGPDNDANGVRDDVDSFIAVKYADTPLARTAVTTYAKNVAAAMLYPNKVSSEAEATKQLAAYFCASDELERAGVPDSGNWNRVVIAKTANTEERMRAYDKWDRNQSGATEIDMETDSCVIARS